MTKVTKDTTIGALLAENMSAGRILMGAGMHCLGCPSAQMETLEEAAMVHGIDCEQLVNALNEYLALGSEE